MPNQSVIRSADFHNARVRIDFCDRVRNSTELSACARLADRQGRAVSAGGRRPSAEGLHGGTYSEGYSLDGADRVAAVARVAGAAQYLMTIHGFARVAHTHAKR